MEIESIDHEKFRIRRLQSQKKYVEYFLSFTLEHMEPTAADYDALEEKFENIMNAFEQAVILNDQEKIIRFAVALHRGGVDGMLTIRNYSHESEYILHNAIQASGENNQYQKSQFLYILALSLVSESSYEEALKFVDQSLQIKEKLKDLQGISNIMQLLGTIWNYKGNYEKAKHYLKLSVETEQRIGEEKGTIAGLNELGLVALYERNYAESEKYFLKAQHIIRKYPNDTDLLNIHLPPIYSNLAKIEIVKRNLDRAEEYYMKCLDIVKRVGYDFAIGDTLRGLGLVAMERDDLILSEKYLRQSLEYLINFKDTPNFTNTLNLLVQVLILKGEFDEAEKNLNQCIEIDKRNGYEFGLKYDMQLLNFLKNARGY